MTKKQNLSGGCQCGHIRYQINGDPLTLYACHCLDCQAQSASAFGLSMWVRMNDFDLLGGELKFWSTKADDGSQKHCAFCPDCGTRIYHVGEDAEIISLKAGSLSDRSALNPVAHNWTKRAHKWLEMQKQNVLCYEMQPESFNDVLAAWKKEPRNPVVEN